MPTVSIVIPVFDGWDTLKQCLDHLARSNYKDFETLVIDHGPENLPRPPLPHSKIPGLRVIRASTDLWWTGATNIGIRESLASDCNYIMLLNHDCFVEPDTIAGLVDFADSHDRVIVAPTQLDASSGKVKVQKACTAFLLGFSTVILRPIRNTEPFVKTGLIIGGRGALIPRSVFTEVGLLDEKHLPHYGSDNDFYLNCKKAGYALWVATGSRVAIDTGSTTEASNLESLSLKQFITTLSNRRSHRNIRDQVSLFGKHYPIPGLYFVGVFLNIFRYSVIYLISRLHFLVHRLVRRK